MWLHLLYDPSSVPTSSDTWPPYAFFITPRETASLNKTLKVKKKTKTYTRGVTSDSSTLRQTNDLRGAFFFHITKQTLTGMVCLFLSRVCIICNPQLFSHLCCFLFIFSSLPPSTFTAPGSVGGSASLQRGRSAELQITLCSPKHQQAFPEPLRSPSTDRFGPFSVL